MRQIVYSFAASLDGYIARPDGSADWIPEDPDIDLATMFKRFDTVLMGRKTYEEAMKSPEAFSDLELHAFSRTQRARPFANRNPVELARELLAGSGKDIWLMGGGELAAEFFREDLVDGIQVAVCPVLLGSGIGAFGATGFPERRFRLANHRVYKQSGIAMLDYVRV